MAAYNLIMKNNKFSQNQKPAAPAPPPAAADLKQNSVHSKPLQGSVPGYNKQHWLEAEAQLVAERNLARVYLFSNGGVK
jgi:hypothetical protein